MIRRAINGFVDAQGWADPFGGFVQRIVAWLYRPFPWLRSFMQGVWLGHPLHPMLTDVPIGALTLALVFDLFFGGGPAADWATALGLLAMFAAAIAGYADYLDLEGRTRNHATVHSTLMLLSVVAYFISGAMRFRGVAIPFAHAEVWIAALGYLLLVFGAYVGGELTFAQGVGVDRHAFRGFDDKWRAIEPQELPDGKHTKVKAGSATLVAVRKGEKVYALHDVCSHMGCNLSEPDAKLEGDAIVCPCHGSKFRLRDGAVLRGPAVYAQPAYESRRTADGKIEVRKLGGA